ncbi:MAG: hypothetical protein WC903_08550 [Candidatus Margulisiibacteriota bacterium]
MSEQVKELIKQIYSAARGLRELFPERPFTPDGHMVGSIGEMYASQDYGIKLSGITNPIHDGVVNGRKVQVKTTQRSGVELKGETDLLLVLKIDEDGGYEEIYNGDGVRPWRSLAHRKPTKSGEKSISIKQLKVLNNTVNVIDKIKRVG